MMSGPEFLIYRSSAGSGKTQTLAGEYLKLILTGRGDFRNVLAITFTNKAAGEMKDRVLELLQLFASGRELAEYQHELLKDIAISGDVSEEVIRKRSARVHTDIIHSYSEFNIGTIDSFVHRIIRSFALELNLSFAFEVQLETDRFIRMSVDDLMERAGEDTELTRNLVGFTRLLLEDEKSWNIDEALVGFGRFLTAEVSMVPVEKIAAADIDLRQVAQSNRLAMQNIAGIWDNIVKKGVSLIDNCGVDHDDFSYKRKGGIPGFFERVLKGGGYEKIYHRGEDAKKMVSWMEEGKPFWNKGAPEEVVEGMTRLAPELRQIWKELAASVDRLWPEYVSRRLIGQNLPNLSLSRKIREQMQVTMNRENLLPIYEFNRLIWNIIRNQPIPFIYERTSERFDHFLIDEFQDTSSMQWMNLLPLIENSLSQGGMSMVVGDAKQAIYRWRNGDVWQFVKLPELDNPDGNPLIRFREEALERYSRQENLRFNYRSSREIVDFNNIFFSHLRDKYPGMLERIYRDCSQEYGQRAGEGYVEITLLPPDDGGNAADDDRNMAEVTLQKVRSLISEDGGITDLSDICILVRKNTEASIIASKLIEDGIEVVSSQSFKLGTFPEAILLRAVTGLMLGRTNSLQATVLVTRLYNAGTVGAREMHDFISNIYTSIKTDRSLYPLINKLFKRCGLNRRFEEYLALPLYEVCEQVIRDLLPENASSAAVQYLLDITSSFVQSVGNDLAAYADYLDEKLDTSVPLPETGRAVQIMTVHKAKGLQFPVVIYAFASESPYNAGNRSKLLWVENDTPEIYHGLPVLLLPFRSNMTDTPFADVYEREREALFQDMINVVYVALTRAEKELYVISSLRNKNRSTEYHLYDIFSGFIESSDLFSTGDNITYSYGTRVIKRAESDSAGKAGLRMPEWVSYQWRDRLGIKTGHLRHMEDVSRSKAIHRGNVIHGILAEACSGDDIPALVAKSVREGLLSAEESEALEADLIGLTGMEDVKPFFDPRFQSRSEASVITPGGKILRPDRVVILPDRVAVLDFKTGSPRDSHQVQVLAYCELLGSMGYKNVKGYLLYIDTRQLKEVIKK